MITGVRAAILCEKVEQTADGQINLHNLYPDILSASTRPGLVVAWLWLLIELDRKPSLGSIKIAAEGLSIEMPISVPSGVGVTGAGFPLSIPVYRPGPLTISVMPSGPRPKPISFRWWLQYLPTAPEVGAARLQELRELVAKNIELLKTVYTPKNPH